MMSKRLPWASWPRCVGLLGVPGWLGLSIGLIAVLAWWQGLPAEQALLDEQNSQLVQLRHHLQAGVSHGQGSSGQASGASLTSRVQGAWQGLWQSLPTPRQGADLQVEVLALARAQGVQVQSVQYKGASLKALPGIWRQQISLPVEGAYPAVRAWLGQMQQRPGLSIDALDIGRTDPMSEQVKARVAISVWWRAPDPEGQP